MVSSFAGFVRYTSDADIIARGVIAGRYPGNNMYLFVGRHLGGEPGAIYVSMTGAVAPFFWYTNSGKSFRTDLSEVEFLAYDCECDYAYGQWCTRA